MSLTNHIMYLNILNAEMDLRGLSFELLFSVFSMISLQCSLYDIQVSSVTLGLFICSDFIVVLYI